ncbi:hypothetical protein SAMD00019534_093110, partial [Acytostelium subglobosum LB1]|uniref:hypothetical protein n=1 Tax=Acytostelium subglobosum LB1 TaxID=1410327 RepID=UPI0006450C38
QLQLVVVVDKEEEGMSSNNKVNAIYQALDSENYKNALKLCNAVLTKKDNNPLVVVLKSIAMQKLGDTEEAIKNMDTVAFQGHTEDNILSNVHYFYRSVNQMDKMFKVWESTYLKHPKELKYLQGVFLTCTKNNDLKNQQKYAIELSRSFPENKHSFWYLMTTLSQALDNPSSTLSIQLAEKLAEKFYSTDKFKTSEESYIYETILMQQNKYKECLKVMQEKLGGLYTYAPERLKTMANLYIKLDMHKEAAESFKEIITKYEPDEWSCYLGYMDAMQSLGDVDKDAMFQWIRSMQPKDSAKPIRGPFIAEIEFTKRCGLPITPLLIEYFKRFGTKPVLFYDFKKYLVDLEKTPVEDRTKLVADLLALVADHVQDRIAQLSNVYRIQRALGLQYNMSGKEVEALVSTFLTEYEKSRVTNLATQQSSERLLGDDLLLLSYHLLNDVYQRDGSLDTLVRAAAILEYGHKSSSKNFQFNLALINVYFRLGASSRALEHIKKLTVKNIQWDTLSYLFFDDVLRTGSFTAMAASLDKCHKFYTENQSTPDFIAQSYTNESYTKVFELRKFMARIVHSFQRACNLTEQQLMNFFIAHASKPEDARAQLNSIPKESYDVPTEQQLQQYTFNQDLNVLDHWDSSEHHGNTAKNAAAVDSFSAFTWNNDQTVAKNQLVARRLILSLLVRSTNQLTSEYRSQLDKLNAIFNGLGCVLATANSDTLSINNDKEFGQAINSITSNMFEYYYQQRTSINSAHKQEDNQRAQTLMATVMSLHKALSTYIHQQQQDKSVLGRGIRLVSTYLETTTWLSYVVGELNKVMPPKKQKKRDEVLLEIRKQFDQFTASLQAGHKQVCDLASTSSIEQGIDKLSVNGPTTIELPPFINVESVQQSYKESSHNTYSELMKYATLINF